MVGIVYIGDIKECPFIDKYIDTFDRANCNYEIIYWDRNNKNNDEDKIIRYSKKSDVNKSKVAKLKDFFCFRKFVNKNIKEKKYDRLVILTTLTGIMIIDKILKKYRNKYIFDIRDFSYEKNKVFFLLEKFLIKNSRFTCISSEGFKNFLPKHNDYIISHNFRYKDLKCSKKSHLKNGKDKINIVYIGAIRQYNHIKNIIDKFNNDNRFNLYFHGDGSAYKDLKKYLDNINSSNIIMTGRYSNDDKFKLLEKADILNNHYEISTNIKYATANKYYDGLIFKIPQICNKDSYDGIKVEREGIGLSVSLDDSDLKEKILSFYKNLDYNDFTIKCNAVLEKILDEDKEYLNRINRFARKGENK